MNKLKNILKDSKTRNFLIAIMLLLATYLFVIFLTERDNSFNEDLPVSNMKNTKDNNIQNILKDELYIIQTMNQEDDGYEIEIYYPYTKDKNLNSYINMKLELYKKDIKFQASNYQNEVQAGKYKLNITFDVTKSSDDNLISFIFIVTQDIKYLHEQETIFVISYDKKNEKIVMPEDIEKMFPNLYYNLSKYTYNELLKDENIINMGALEIVKEGTKANRYNFMDIAFKEDNI